MSRTKAFPPKKPWTLDKAQDEIARLARWAEKMGFQEIAQRLEWSAMVIDVHRGAGQSTRATEEGK